MQEIARLLYPLDEFYAESGLPLPAAERLEESAIPSPHRRLLVHGSLMTSVLERHFGRTIGLRVLQARANGTSYARTVVLVLDGSAEAVAFGAIKLDLARFDPAVRREIVAAGHPLGHVLRERGCVYGGCPRAFLRVTPDAKLAAALECNGTRVLYGRRSTLVDAAGEPLAEIVEIVSPSPPTHA